MHPQIYSQRHQLKKIPIKVSFYTFLVTKTHVVLVLCSFSGKDLHKGNPLVAEQAGDHR